MASKRILIIDDEPTIRAIVCLCLSKVGGYEVIEAASGQEGLMIAIKDPPDAILLDLCMPEMDGVEVLRQLQASQSTLSIPIVILSAVCEASSLWVNATLANPAHTLKDKVADIIPKPFNPLTLPGQIAAACHWS